MKKIIKLGMAALTALTMAGCSSESEDVKTITVGISPDYAPYESENKKGDIIYEWIFNTSQFQKINAYIWSI